MVEENKKFPCDAKNCLECVHYVPKFDYYICWAYQFKILVPEYKNCDRGDCD